MAKSRSGKIRVKRRASRSSRRGSHASAVARPYEEREIVVAQGIQFHNTCYLSTRGWEMPDGIVNRPKGPKTLTIARIRYRDSDG